MINQRQLETLYELEACKGWARPMDVGGTNGSHHSATLRWLYVRGFAERRQRSARGVRGSWEYRITPAARSLVRQGWRG